ncbi:MAG: DMT family transporter [Candidatus Limnocylindria bacterium]
MVVAAICFGTLGPLSRFAEDAGVEALTLVTWRAGLGAAAVAAVIAVGSAMGAVRTVSLSRLPLRERWILVMAAGANTLLNLSVFAAFGRVSIALALLVFYTYPAVVAVASVLWFGERMDGLRWAALFVSGAGLVLVLAGAGGVGELDPVGIGLSFAAGLAQVAYVLAARHGFVHVPGAQAAAMTMSGAVLLYVAIAAVAGGLGALGQPLASSAALWPVLAAGTVGAGVPTVCYITGIRLLGAPRAAIVATLEPVVGVGFAAWLLGEQPAAVQLLGAALILGAAVLLQVRSPTRPAEHEALADT